MQDDADLVEVFHFRVYNGTTDETVQKASKRTLDDISRIRGEVIEGTGEMVRRSDLDAQDRYYPEPR